MQMRTKVRFLILGTTFYTNNKYSGFSITTPTSNTYRVAAVGMRRAGTIVRSPLEARREKKDKEAGELRSSEVRLL